MLELIQREEDLDTLFEVSPTIKLMVEPKEYSIIRVNHRAHQALQLADNPSDHPKLTDFIDKYDHKNRSFLKTLDNVATVNEYEIVILATDKSPTPMLASVRKMRIRGNEVIIVGMTDISEIKKAQEVLEQHATIDDLTGLLNRRAGMLMLAEFMAQSRRTNKELSLCFIDIDGLKLANDQYGHKNGDWLITTVAGWQQID